jgi:Na+/proline symporter
MSEIAGWLFDQYTWFVLAGYAVLVYLCVPKEVSPSQFYEGRSKDGVAPSFWTLVASLTISWIFAKSIANAANMSQEFGAWGGLGYAIYYLSFITAGIAIYLIRTRTGASSISAFLSSRYNGFCARLFLLAISVRLFNEVWSNTKVAALYFGQEASGAYWVAVLLFTGFTMFYSWKGGLRSSLLTDGLQMILMGILLGIVLAMLSPGLYAEGLSEVSANTRNAGLTFCALAFVQIFSYPFHDPVLTDRGFLTEPGTMLRAFFLSALIGGGFIFLFGITGLYAQAFDISGDPTVAVPASIGIPALMIFNVVMLTSAGSTLDSTFSSMSKLAVRDWTEEHATPDDQQVRTGRWVMLLLALVGNLPLLTYYLGDQVGPAIISATTISGTMVVGLAPIFLLSFLPGTNRVSFHLAFWPGMLLGILRVVHRFNPFLPDFIHIGTGSYALSLGLNVYGLAFCTVGFLLGNAATWMYSGNTNSTSERASD